jgi:hypothetical protein
MFGVSGLRYLLLARANGPPAPPRGAGVRYGAWALAWVAGHVAGGAALGAALGWAGSGLSPGGRLAGLGMLGLGCLAGAMHQFGVVRLPLPQLPRQVPRGWMGRLPWDVVAVGYGLQLGCGVATRIKVATTYAVLGCCFLSGSAAAGGLVLGLFGAARAALPVAVGPRVADPAASLAFTLAFDAYEGAVRRLNGAALLAAAAALTGATARHLLGA